MITFLIAALVALAVLLVIAFLRVDYNLQPFRCKADHRGFRCTRPARHLGLHSTKPFPDSAMRFNWYDEENS